MRLHDRKMKPTLMFGQKNILAMSRAQYFASIRDTKPADKLDVGVCIFRTDAQTSRPSVLLLRRSLRWQQYPGTWELPGGKVANEDYCISAALTRRVHEETGLRVVKILGALQELRHVDEIKILEWDDCVTGSSGGDGSEAPPQILRREHVQLNFTVLVEDAEDIKLKSKEHDAMAWASFSRVEDLKMSREMRMLVHQALAWAGEYLF